MSRIVTLPPTHSTDGDGSVGGGWWHEVKGGRIVCDLCPRACTLKPGDRGFCFVRENRDGQMVLSTYGRSTGFCIDPIEKKPLNHFYPGTSVLSFGTAGCNLGCKFCQNWSISKSREIERLSERATPEMIAEAARQLGCRSVAFTYNDPVIWAEYAIDVARACRALGVKTVAVTAGYITPVARQPFYEVMDAANVDLKAFTEVFYQHLTLSHLEPVLETLVWLKKETDVWFEVTNLVIPRANDSQDEIRQMCDWLLENLGDDIPVHFTAFHPDFRLRDRPPTPPETLVMAWHIAKRAGLKHVYVGNVDDAQHQSTYCAGCGKLVIERNWYELGAYALRGRTCQFCGTAASGRFDSQPGVWGRRRLPVQISQFGSAPRPAPSHQGDVAMPSTPSRPKTLVTADVVRPELSDAQRQAVAQAASELVRAAVTDTPARLPDATLAGASDIPVLGCFVSIKRQGKLRGCCGFLGRVTPLLAALRESAVTSAIGDVRLPPVSPTELLYLDFEVWLLYGQTPIPVNGPQRVEHVVVGQHGLQIQKGEARGLLLPGVAVDHGLDSEGFLRQVCLKAGLPATAWRDDDAQLATFEGVCIACPFDSGILSGAAVARPPLFTEQEVVALASFCRDNILAIARGATPNYYLLGGPDGSAHGIALDVRVAGRAEPLESAQLSLRKTSPVQSTLFQMSEALAHRLRSEGRQNLGPADVEVRLAVLDDPAVHGLVSEPDLSGLDASVRAVLVIQGNRSAWIFDPAVSGPELVWQAVEAAKVQSHVAAGIYSYRVSTNTNRFSIANVPRPAAGSKVRPPAVAGLFYPRDPEQLDRLLDQLMPDQPVARKAYRAAMVPHAGLQYSGRIAADVLRRIDIPHTVIVLGPKHTRLGVEFAVAPHEVWSLPGRSVSSDPDLAQSLCEAIQGLEMDSLAHQAEHAIEVELPWFARLAPSAKVVGVALGSGDLNRCQEFAEGLAEFLRSRSDPPLLVISTDMNHYANDAETRRVDRIAIDAIKQLDPGSLYHTVRDNDISMCGILPAVIVLDALRQLGQLSCAEEVAYGTSADVSGDTSRVVGYAGMLFS